MSGTSAPGAKADPRAVTVAVTSGKGGVGKTSVAVNLAVSLARLRHRVAVVDADFGLGNVDVLLGLAPTAHIGHVLAGEKSLGDITVEGPLGVRIVPASSGLQDLTSLNARQWQRLADALDGLCREVDYLLIDTAAGISDNVLALLVSVQRVLVVTSLEPSAIVDAYALIKVLTAADPQKDVAVVVNGAHDAHEAELVFRQLDVAASRFLHRHLDFFGFVAQDPAVRESVLAQRAIVDHRPQSAASRCFRVLASRLAGIAPGNGAGLRLVGPHAGRKAVAPVAEVQPCV